MYGEHKFIHQWTLASPCPRNTFQNFLIFSEALRNSKRHIAWAQGRTPWYTMVGLDSIRNRIGI